MRHLIPSLTLLAGLAGTPVQAEVLLIDAIRQAAGVSLPAAGVSAETVRVQFGEPRSTVPAVGEPPISRWVYDGYTVYFEYDRVIHAVVHRDSPAAQP